MSPTTSASSKHAQSVQCISRLMRTSPPHCRYSLLPTSGFSGTLPTNFHRSQSAWRRLLRDHVTRRTRGRVTTSQQHRNIPGGSFLLHKDGKTKTLCRCGNKERSLSLMTSPKLLALLALTLSNAACFHTKIQPRYNEVQ